MLNLKEVSFGELSDTDFYLIKLSENAKDFMGWWLAGWDTISEEFILSHDFDERVEWKEVEHCYELPK